jgi:SAM-dependent methyltransferase
MDNQAFVKKSGRLALFRNTADAAFWDQQWTARSEATIAHALRRGGNMASFGGFFKKWLPKDGVVLEAGCGTGLWVKRLSDRGYRCVGLDFAEETLRRSKRICPSLQLINGDIFTLPFKKEFLSAYVSFGVVEHFEEGPQNALREAFRVLKKNGVALISVPFENRIREKVLCSKEADARRQGLAFYQYYFSYGGLRAELEHAGFVVQPGFRGYGVWMGLKQIPFLSIISRIPKVSVWSPLLDKVPFLSTQYAHMMFCVAIKQ